MVEKVQSTPEDIVSVENIQNVEKKPGFFRRAFREVTGGITNLIKGVDRVITHIPLVGEVYGTAKGIARGVWRATEHVPFLKDINAGIRKESAYIHKKIEFTPSEEQSIKSTENTLLSGLQEVRNNVIRDMPESEIKKDLISCYNEVISHIKAGTLSPEVFNKLSAQYPQFREMFDKYMAKADTIKTGKENIHIDDLISESKKLQERLVQLGGDKNIPEKTEIDEKKYDAFRKKFPSLPAFDTMKDNSELYAILQNMYFGRQSQPDLKNPLVHDFIQKTIVLTLAGNDDPKKYEEAYKDHYNFVSQKSRDIAAAFQFNDFENAYLEKALNERERINRLPPELPHQYSGSDYGANKFFDSLHAIAFPETREERVQKGQALEKARTSYRGTTLSIFQGGH